MDGLFLSRFVVDAEMMDKSAPVKAVDVLIVGGGVCGVLAAHRCNEKSLSYCLIERQSDFGGVWASLANEHSHLQVSYSTIPMPEYGNRVPYTTKEISRRLLKRCTDGTASIRSVPSHWPKSPDQRSCRHCDVLHEMQTYIRTLSWIAACFQSISLGILTGKIRLTW